MRAFPFTLLAMSGLILAGCAEPEKPLDLGSLQTPEEACIAQVRAATGETDIEAISTEATETATIVTVGVGPDRTAWTCTLAPLGTREAERRAAAEKAAEPATAADVPVEAQPPAVAATAPSASPPPKPKPAPAPVKSEPAPSAEPAALPQAGGEDEAFP